MAVDIGGVRFGHGVFAAPLASVSDPAFRQMCTEHGAELVYTEMISAKAIHYHDKKTDGLADISKDKRPVCIQLFGHEPDIIAEAAAHISEKFAPDIIDINMGCPARKIVSSGDGCALMKDIGLISDIVKAAVGSTKIPVTVKMRAGWDSKSKNAVEAALAAEDAGASAVCVHGRTKEQMYSSEVDTGIIAEVKKRLKIPVIGNGGIMSARDAVSMFEKTGCDAVMIARGSRGCPWIFEDIITLLEGGEPPVHGGDQIIEAACRHLDLLCADKGEQVALRESRGHLVHYIRDFRGAAKARAMLMTSDSIREIKEILRSLLQT